MELVTPKFKDVVVEEHDCSNCDGKYDTHGECGCNKHEEPIDESPIESNIITLPQENDNIRVEIFRNRSVMECRVLDISTGEILLDRLPVNWKSRDNKLDYLSVSKIKAYEDCPACFYQQYMADETSTVDNGNFYTKFGTILHEVVEKASEYYKNFGLIIDPITIYDEVWKTNSLPVDGTHSAFGTYLEGKELIRDYFKRSPMDQRTDDMLFVEKEWRGELGGCTFGLMIDYVGVMKSNPSVGILKDYKTNRMPFTPAELDESLQLKIYEIILRRHLAPQIETWISGYEMFRFGWQQCPPRTEEDLYTAEQYIANMWDKISNDNTWEETLNNYCGFRQCRLTCKSYKDYIDNPKRYIDMINIEGVDLNTLDTERENLTKYEKIAKGRKDECSNILKSAIEDAMKQDKVLVINGNELQLYSNGTQSYNYYDTKNVLLVNNALDILDKCMTIGKTKLDKELANRPDLKLALSKCTNTNFATPYIVKKKYVPGK